MGGTTSLMSLAMIGAMVNCVASVARATARSLHSSDTASVFMVFTGLWKPMLFSAET